MNALIRVCFFCLSMTCAARQHFTKKNIRKVSIIDNLEIKKYNDLTDKLQRQIDHIKEQEQINTLQKQVAQLEKLVPPYVQNIEILAKKSRNCSATDNATIFINKTTPPTNNLLKECELTVPTQIRELAKQLMHTPAHAQLECHATKEAFMDYINLINPSMIKWIHNVRKNKYQIQTWLHNHGTQLTREEFLRVNEILAQCLATYNNTLQPNIGIDKPFRILAQREAWRFFYIAHGNSQDLLKLLEQANSSNNALAWALITVKRLGGQNGPGVPDDLLQRLITLYATKSDALIANAPESIKPLYEQFKTTTLQFLQSLKKAS